MGFDAECMDLVRVRHVPTGEVFEAHFRGHRSPLNRVALQRPGETWMKAYKEEDLELLEVVSRGQK